VIEARSATEGTGVVGDAHGPAKEPDTSTFGVPAMIVSEAESDAPDVSAAVHNPTEVVRIGGMVEAILEEIRERDPDRATRRRLASIHAHALTTLRELLSADLAAEIDELELRLAEGHVPTTAEIRSAYAQLLGWLSGLLGSMHVAVVSRRLVDEKTTADLRQQAIQNVREEEELQRRRHYL
jgi:hypothetical protein